MKKIKVIQMPLSRVFPATHEWKGEQTYFEQKIKNNFAPEKYEWRKLHTCRQDYGKWKEKIDEINSGDAILLVYEWLGKPYSSEGRRNIFVFGNGTDTIRQFVSEKYPEVTAVYDSGLGIQKLEIREMHQELYFHFTIDGEELVPFVDYRGDHIKYWAESIAKNDGLSWVNFKEWFKNDDFSVPMAIIHFTDFRY